jgi:hypothetical protein
VGMEERLIVEKSKQLEQIQRQEGVLDVDSMQQLKEEIFTLIDKEELFWR